LLLTRDWIRDWIEWQWRALCFQVFNSFTQLAFWQLED
jgi:hypothetical protein